MDTEENVSRIEAITRIIEQKKPASQQEILLLLKEKYLIGATQTQVSRDLKRLGVITKIEEGKKLYSLPNRDAEIQMLKIAITNIEHNETSILITTLPGLAPFIGDIVDRAKVEVLGCIAGENAVLVLPRTIMNIHSVFKDICSVLCFKREIK